MAKIVLGNRPVNFTKTITVPMHDGSDGQMEVIYKYRTLTEFGAFIDQWAAEAETKIKEERAAKRKKKDADAATSNEEVRKTQAQANADYLMRILDGWNLDVEFGESAVLQLCNELPGAADKIIGDYRMAITEGRLGN